MRISSGECMINVLNLVDLNDVVEELTQVLEEELGKRDPSWPHVWCILSRLAHIAIWDECPEDDYVKKVIGLLLKGQEEILSADMSIYGEEEAGRIGKHVRNIKCRIKNLQDNYLPGKPSAFEPDDELED